MFGRFEAADPNELWVGDALHGPRVGDRKTYLFAFLDDHSRLLPGYRFGFAEDTVRLAAALRPALAARGVPAGIYVDNGSAFVDAWLLRACAKLGVRLVHSQPGRPQGRGKIERFFRTVREQFLVEVTDTTSEDLTTAGVDHTTALLELESPWKWHCHVGECGRPGRIRGVTTATPSYKGHRYPVEIINHCVWLYFRFPLSLREVEELMLARGVAVSYETIRRWCAKFGQAYANQLRRRRPRPGDKWHLDEVFVGINGRLRYLWRAVDQHGNVLDVLVQSRRNAVAAKRFFRKLLKGLRYVPRVLVTDKLGSYQVAHRELMSSVEHRRSRHLNNRAENSHQPTRQRERAMKRFKSLRHAQRFLSAFSGISAHFRPRRHLLSATEWRTEMADRFAVWRQVTAPDAAA